jgi:hypothetical protein
MPTDEESPFWQAERATISEAKKYGVMAWFLTVAS